MSAIRPETGAAHEDSASGRRTKVRKRDEADVGSLAHDNESLAWPLAQTCRSLLRPLCPLGSDPANRVRLRPTALPLIADAGRCLTGCSAETIAEFRNWDFSSASARPPMATVALRRERARTKCACLFKLLYKNHRGLGRPAGSLLRSRVSQRAADLECR